MSAHRLGAVIVTHSQPALARQCLASLRPLVTPEHAVVVVNAPDDADPESLEALAACALVIANERPRGYGENLNRGAEALSERADYLLLLNDDLIFDEGAVEQLIATLDADPSAGLAAPSIIDPQGARQASVFAFPSVRSEVIQAAVLPSPLADLLRAPHARAAAAGVPERVDWVLGAAMLVRRRAFDDVGGFDPGFFLYSEETDLCRRLHDHGWSVLSCGDAVVTHIAAASTSDQRFSRILGRSRGRYLRRTLSHRRQLALSAALVAVALWNVLYVAGRVLLEPRSAADKLDLLKQRWRQRTILQRRDRRRPDHEDCAEVDRRCAS